VAKKQTFADKLKKKEGSTDTFVKLVKAVRDDNGAWKFRTQMVAVNDTNRKEKLK
jgi:hypothetical protein